MLSLLNRNWILAQPDADLVRDLARDLGVSPVIAEVLVNRNIITVPEGRCLIDSDLTQLHDPFLMTGMRTAADRVVRAIQSGESITLFCDYDVDGVTSAAFLTHFFRDLGVSVDYYLPERMTEGYGLNPDALRKIRDRGSTLVITADCGITAVSEVAFAREIGLDVIVSDHHQVGTEGLPDAVAVLNPHRPDCNYPFRFLSGVGIVFKLATAVRTALHEAGWEKDRLPNLRRHLDLFVLGTIADVAPLTGENHILSSHGLAEITTSSKPGLVELKAVSGLNGRVDARAVGFALGPRLNAAGRLGKADVGLHLLTATDQKEARELARSLDETNQERRAVQNESLEEAEYLLDREVDLERDRVIVLASENFHAGVIGIVASRLADKYYRPVVLIALDEDKGKGSARSIPRFNLFKAFCDCSRYLIQFGGHAYAAGLNIARDQVEPFREAINEVGRRFLADEALVREQKVDAVLDLSQITPELYKEIRTLEPFGAENPTPVFMSRGIKIENLRYMGRDDSHVRFRARQRTGRIEAVAFNMGGEFASFDVQEGLVDLAYELQINDWNGREKLELKLLDLKFSSS